jgi:hypothetical protein
MKRKTVTLTPDMLRKIIFEEKQKLHEENLSKKLKTPADKAKETTELVDAGDYADTLEKHIDMLKALKVRETRIRAELRNIDERRQKLIKKIS